MAAEFDLLSPTDKPALLVVTRGETLETCKTVLASLGYKVHTAADADEFLVRFPQASYQLVIFEDSGDSTGDSAPLKSLQTMPMNQRRHAVTVLVGDSYQTLHPMQAFQKSVHGVVNKSDLPQLSEIIRKIVSDNDLFYGVYRDTQLRMAEGK